MARGVTEPGRRVTPVADAMIGPGTQCAVPPVRAAPRQQLLALSYFGGKTANASTSTSHSGLTSADTPTVERAGFTGFVALLKNWPYAAFHPCVSIVPPFSLSGTR